MKIISKRVWLRIVLSIGYDGKGTCSVLDVRVLFASSSCSFVAVVVVVVIVVDIGAEGGDGVTVEPDVVVGVVHDDEGAVVVNVGVVVIAGFVSGVAVSVVSKSQVTDIS